MGKKVAILGGTGKMGRWFAHFFQAKGYEVTIASRSRERAAKAAEELSVKSADSYSDAVKDVDVVVASTPIETTAQTIREVKGKLTPGTVLFDIASVKGDIPKALSEAALLGAKALSIHPLFGPGATTLKGKKVIVIPITKDAQLIEWIRGLFEEDGAETHVVASGEEHDRMIGITLSLTHFINIALAKTLSKYDIHEIKKFAGTTFTLQLMLIEAVLTEDPNLYYVIESTNPVFRDILDGFLKAAQDIASKIYDRDAFVETFVEARENLSKDSDFASAYQRFYKALESSTTQGE